MGTQPAKSVPQSQQPARGNAAPAETRPEDLHIPEELPPPMPELADKPAVAAGAGPESLQPSLCPLPGADTACAPATAAPAETRPEDLHIPEELPPPMPELADKPKRT